MRPLTASEAADLARVCQHRHFCQVEHLITARRWWIEFRDECDEMVQAIGRRTLRACIKAAVRWIEENP